MLVVKSPPANEGDTRDAGSIPGSERSPGKGNGKQVFLPRKYWKWHSSILAWKIPWAEEPGRL